MNGNNQNKMIRRVCTTCLTFAGADSFINLDDQLFYMLKIVSPELPVFKSEHSVICFSCNFLLSTSYAFKKTCYQTRNKLNQYINKRKAEKARNGMSDDNAEEIKRRKLCTDINLNVSQTVPTSMSMSMPVVENNNKTDNDMHDTRIVFNDTSCISTDKEADLNKQTKVNGTKKDSLLYTMLSTNEPRSVPTKPTFNTNKIHGDLELSDESSSDTVILDDNDTNDNPIITSLVCSIFNSRDSAKNIVQTDQYKDFISNYNSCEFIDLEELHKWPSIMDKHTTNAEHKSLKYGPRVASVLGHTNLPNQTSIHNRSFIVIDE